MRTFIKYFIPLAVVLSAVGAVPSMADDIPAETAPRGLQAQLQYIDTAGNVEKSDNADDNADGKLHLAYDTRGGQWLDPDGGKHDNGTYVVTIPTLIKYLGMNAGRVNTSDNYTVNVKGVIGADDVVHLTAETGKVINNGTDTYITENTVQGKTEWNASDCYGKLNELGCVTGTDATDNISFTGEAKSDGTFTGTVQYTASASLVLTLKNGKEIVQTRPVKAGDPIVEKNNPLPTLTKEGYTFIGWFMDDGSGAKIEDNTVMPDSDTQLAARWKLNEYTVLVHAEQGKINGSEDDAELDYSVESPFSFPVAERYGFRLMGWYTAPIGGDKITEAYVNSKHPKDIYAQWEDKSKKYSHTPNIDNTGISRGNYGNYWDITDTVTIPNAKKIHVKVSYDTENKWDYVNVSSPTLSATTLSGNGSWEKDIDGSSVTFYFHSDRDQNRYGYYAVVSTAEYADPYEVVFNANGGSGAMQNELFTPEDGEKTLAANAFKPAYDNYHFSHWNTMADGSGLDLNDEQVPVFGEIQKYLSAENGKNILNLYAQWRTTPLYSHTPNINDTGASSDNYGSRWDITDTVTIPNAKKIHVKVSYGTENRYDYVNVSSPTLSATTLSGNGSWEKDIDGNSVTFYFHSDRDENRYGYYAIVTGC